MNRSWPESWRRLQQEYLAFPELGLALDFTRVPDARRNPAARLALAWWLLTDGRGARALVVLPYKDQLELFARYLQQLVLESLGKAFNALGTWCSSVGPLFGCIPVTGGVARSVANVRFDTRTPVAGLVHSALLLVLLLAAAPLLSHIPLATLSAVLVVSAYRMVSWKQFLRLSRWPFSDSSVFLATFALTVLTNLTLAVEVGVVLAALLMVKRISETSQITAVDESTETEGSHHSLVGREILPGVLVFRVFGVFFSGVVDKLDDESKRAKQEPDILILRVRKVLEKAGFLDHLGRKNVCPNSAASLTESVIFWDCR